MELASDDLIWGFKDGHQDSVCLDNLVHWPLPALLVRWALSIGGQDGYVSLRPSSSSHRENPGLKGASLLIASSTKSCRGDSDWLVQWTGQNQSIIIQGQRTVS